MENKRLPKLEEAGENETLEEKNEVPWKALIFCGVIFVLIVALVIVLLVI